MCVNYLVWSVQVHGPIQLHPVHLCAGVVHQEHQPGRHSVPLHRPGDHHHSGSVDGEDWTLAHSGLSETSRQPGVRW